MDRRSFLSRSAAAALLAAPALAAGCGGSPIPPTPAAAEARELIARLERGLRTIRDVPVGAMASAMPWQVRPDVSEHVLRLGLEALVVADVTRSVPEGVRPPRELVQRLQPELAVVDRCTATYHALLTRMPPAVRRNISLRFRERQDVATDVAS